MFRILQWSTIAVFAGRAYQHLFWDAPYRELFWDPFFMKGLVEKFGSLSWDEYVTHPAGDIWFQKFVFVQGIFYLVCVLVAVFIKKLPKWCRWVLVIGALDLVFLALLYMKDKFYHFGQFFEYSLQFGSPLFLVWFLKKGNLSNSLIFWMKVAFALTFTCHGLYAIGYYPQPGTYMTMVYNIMGLDKEGMDLFLSIAGILDFVVAFSVFILKGKWLRAALWYAVVWGVLTTLARIVGNFYWDFPLESLHQWVYAAVFRFPHFLIPLGLVLLAKSRASKSNR